MSTASSIAVGAHQATEVVDVFAIIGAAHSVGDGWARRDSIVMDGVEIGALHVREQHGRIRYLSQAGDAYIMGRDVEWIAERSGRRPLPPLAANETITSTLAPRRRVP